MSNAAPQLSNADWLAIEREYCARSLSHFTRRAWSVLEPAMVYTHNWHIDAVCEHLEAVTAGEITRLLINVPPGTMKSLLSGVFWPSWEWGPRGLAPTRFVSASHAENYALRDARRMRQLVTSEWYQALWPLKLASDQNAAGKFENEATGFRHAMPVRSMTGSRGDRVLWDDPHSVEDALSDADLARTARIFHETLPTRLNSPEHSAIVIIMQRLAVGDVSGLAIEEDLGYEHLMLPMEFEPDRRCTTSIGFTDPRTQPDELLFPDRFPRHVVDRDKKALGVYATAGQLQQRPAPRGGGMLPVDNVQIMPAAPDPAEIEHSVRYWDKAGTEGGGDYTAGVLMHRLKDGRYVVADVTRGQWHAPKRERRLRQAAVIDGVATHIWVEQEPGSGGKESAQASIRNLAGFVARADKVTGDKATRAESYAVQFEQGNVWLVRAAWNTPFLDEHEVFPVGKHKDQVDAAAGAFNKLAISANQFIQPRVVVDAMDRDLDPAQYAHFPVYLGVRISQLPDEPHVIIRRQGPKVWPATTATAATDAMEFAGIIAHESTEQRAAGVFIDGVGEGIRVVRRLAEMGINVIDVQSGTAAVEPLIFKDRATENWYRMREWVRGEVDLPAGDNALRNDMTAPEYDIDRQQRMVLESFDDMRERVAAPPCTAAALAMTFADFRGARRKGRARNVRKVRWA